jgi:transcription elongation factor Elf1
MYETAFECSCCGRITKEGTVKRDDGQIVCEMCDYDLRLEE